MASPLHPILRLPSRQRFSRPHDNALECIVVEQRPILPHAAVVAEETHLLTVAVRPEDRVEFLRYVQEQLLAIRDNPTLASAYGCDPRRVIQKALTNGDVDMNPRQS